MSGHKKKSKRQVPRERTKVLKKVVGPVGRIHASRNAMTAKVQLVNKYAATLMYPFDYPGLPLGWGTMVNTSIGQCRARGQFILAPADGSGNLLMTITPNSLLAAGTSPLGTNIAGFAVAPLYNPGVVPANRNTVIASAGSVRVVSAGIRCWTNLPMTSAPGEITFAAIPRTGTTTVLNTLTTAQLNSLQEMELGQLTPGGAVEVNWRPVDLLDYEFLPGSSNAIDGTILAITFANFPNGANTPTVYYEYVVNFEYIYAAEQSIAPATLSPQGPSLASVGTAEAVNEWLRRSGVNDKRNVAHTFNESNNPWASGGAVVGGGGSRAPSFGEYLGGPPGSFNDYLDFGRSVYKIGKEVNAAFSS